PEARAKRPVSSPALGEAGSRRRRPRSSLHLLIPRQQPRRSNHNGYASRADENMHRQPVGYFGEHEMVGEGEEHAETEDRQRMLAAEDRRLEDRVLQRRPAARHETQRDHRKREEM